MFKVKFALLAVLLLGVTSGDHPIGWERDFDSEPIEFDADILRNDLTREDAAYRLPVNVVPLEYDVDIDLHFDEAQSVYSYDGRVEIVIQAVEENVTEIVLHANVDEVNSLSLLSSDDVPVNMATPSMTLQPQYHFIRLHLAETLVVGANYSLHINYYSTMNEGPLRRGIWRGHYVDASGTRRTYATTHFQPYNARQAFPCWDEPFFKAEFTLHLTHPADYSAVFSNTGIETRVELENGSIRDNFLKTPKMSSYLVTFLVSQSFQVIAEDNTFDPPIRIIGRSNAVGHADQALRLAVGMTMYFEDYFQIPFRSLHPNLYNDHIASPDWASAGTENWGMVSYRELYLILSSNETIMSVEHYAATLVSHELAHKWFGNLITCFWWSETWINEGFASYFGYIPTSVVFPEYEHQDHFNSRYLQTSLSTDSGTGTAPLNNPVSSPAQVTGHFGTISYSKGAAFLRMINDMITPETFRKACQYFLQDNSYEPTDQTDLFNAFNRAVIEDGTLQEYSNFDFSDFYYTWVNEAGYPILDVDIDYSTGEITLRQERFFLSAAAGTTDQVYPIPITYSTQNNPEFTNLKPVYMMTSQSDVINKDAGEEWVIFNNLQHGHYRVNYNERNWELISEALLNDPDSIHFLNRAQIVNDVYALMRSERMSYGFGFRVLRFLRSETNYHVWEPAITMFTWLRNRLSHLPTEQATFESFILSYMEQAIELLGLDVQENESPTISMFRQDMLHFACLLRHEQCVEESKRRFVAFRENGEFVDPRIRRNVFVIGIRDGGVEDFEFLLNRFLQSNFANDQLEMLRGLGATRDTALLYRYLQLTLTSDVRTQDKSTALNYALLGNPENGHTVMKFVMDNIDDIRRIFQEDAPNNPVHTVISNVAAYLDEEGLDEYEDWLRTTQSSSIQFATGISAIGSARNNRAWGTANADTIIGAARDGAGQLVVSAVVVIVLTAVAMMA